MKVKQAQLHSTGEVPAILTCWTDPIVAKGQIITLEDCPNIRWKVMEVFEVELDSKQLYKPWRVGGLE